MFFSILAHHKKNKVIGHDRQTISAHFHEVVKSLLKLHQILLVKPALVDEIVEMKHGNGLRVFLALWMELISVYMSLAEINQNIGLDKVRLR